MQVITVAQLKGGSGKSTTAAAVAQAAAAAGDKVLVIDLDPSGNLSFFLGANGGAPGSLELLEGSGKAEELTQETAQGIDVIAARQDLATIRTASASARRLLRALRPIEEKYNVIIIDTPATLSELHYNALNASTGLLIPLECDLNNLEGLYQVTDIARQIQGSNADLTITGVIVTRYDGRPNLNRYLRDAIRKRAEDLEVPYLMEIRQGTAIREAQSFQKSLFDYAPKSKPAADYAALYKTIRQED